jgi:hypothetical protein
MTPRDPLGHPPTGGYGARPFVPSVIAGGAADHGAGTGKAGIIAGPRLRRCAASAPGMRQVKLSKLRQTGHTDTHTALSVPQVPQT